MSEAGDLLAALAPVAAAFGRLGVWHYVGGSVASTVHGAIRSTMDVDLVCDLRADQIETFVAAFGDEFYSGRSTWPTCGGWPNRSVSAASSSGS